jgi:hypothetical protein
MNPAIPGESLAGLLQGAGFELLPLLGFRPALPLLLLGSGSSSASKCVLAAALPVPAMNTTCSASHVSSVQERTCNYEKKTNSRSSSSSSSTYTS